MHVSLEVTLFDVAQVPYSEAFRLAKFRLFSKAFRGRPKLSIFPMGLTLQERYDDQDDLFSSSTLYSPFLWLHSCVLQVLMGAGANFFTQRLEENQYQ